MLGIFEPWNLLVTFPLVYACTQNYFDKYSVFQTFNFAIQQFVIVLQVNRVGVSMVYTLEHEYTI